jgi:hypothetical protein
LAFPVQRVRFAANVNHPVGIEKEIKRKMVINKVNSHLYAIFLSFSFIWFCFGFFQRERISNQMKMCRTHIDRIFYTHTRRCYTNRFTTCSVDGGNQCVLPQKLSHDTTCANRGRHHLILPFFVVF